MTHVLERVQVVPGRLDAVFAFHTDPYNLEALTPPWLRFRVTRSTDERVRHGTRIQYKMRLHGIPLGWSSEISEFVDGVMFADRMLTGPYRHWYHTHRFRQVAVGVEIRDRVEYALPLGPLGRATHSLIVRGQLERIFDFRADALERLMRPAPVPPPHLVLT